MYARVDIDYVAARQKLARIRGRFANWYEVAEDQLSDLMSDFMEQQFATEGAAGGTPWQELAESTLRIKAKTGGDTILRRYDRLYEAATSGYYGNRDLDVRVGKDSYTWRLKVPYAHYHQFGSPGGRIPRREIVPEEMPHHFMVRLRNIVVGVFVEAEFRT